MAGGAECPWLRLLWQVRKRSHLTPSSLLQARPSRKSSHTRPVTLTSRGAVFLGVSLTLVVAGFFRIDGVLISLGAAGILLALLSWVVGRWNLAGCSLHLTAPHRVFADTPVEVSLSVLNHKALLGTCQLDLTLDLCQSAPLSCRAPWTAAGSTSTTRLRGRIPARGSVEIHPCAVQSTFPFGLFHFRRQTTLRHEMLVFPRAIVPREFFASGHFDDAADGGGEQAGNAPGEPRGLRPFEPGDRAKQIHWPATIRALFRGRKPRVREYDPPGLRPRRARVIFHSFGTDHTLIRTDLFERALALTCGTLRHLRGLGIPATLVADFFSWKARPSFQAEAWSETLTVLAEAQRAGHTEAHDLLAEIEKVPSETALIIISDMPPAAWEHVVSKRPLLVINIRQHRFGNKDLRFDRPTPAVAS